MSVWSEFHGPNAGYVLEMYERYRRDPGSVDAATRAYFEHWVPATGDNGEGPAAVSPGTLATAAASVPAGIIDKIAGAVNLAQAIREYGHLEARLDPLGSEPIGDPSLSPEYHGITDEDLHRFPASLVGGPVAETTTFAFEAIQALRSIYSGTIGYDWEHIRVPEERDWLREAAETGRFRPPRDPIDPGALLERLTQVEVFERFLHRVFPGKTRFSIEGIDILVPILDQIIVEAAATGIHRMLLGMAHRGRLNVLVHVLNKPYAQVMAEFKDPVEGHKFMTRSDLGWTGDVKYHHGASRALHGGKQVELVVHMPSNPSHLEHINPVIEGMARAAGTRVDQSGAPRFDHTVTLPVLIHGDGAFAGQGIVAETLNFSRLEGYTTGGTIHIITNNQLGYTTPPESLRSTLYASDLAKGFRIPIVHVNADDPEACIEAARMAYAFRARFQQDFLIDLIGYRRYGHNEGDEPTFTQPLMYDKIQQHPTVSALWAKTLVERGLVDRSWPEELVQKQMQELQAVLDSLQPVEDIHEPPPEAPPPGAAGRVKTAVSADRLREFNEALLQVPSGFEINPKLQRAMQRRRSALDDLDEPGVEWAAAEALAFASILADGIAIRLTGEDAERGTFSQRHAVFHDVGDGSEFIPLQALPQSRAAFEVRNSPLSEVATVGFEYGYNVQEPGRLVLWEAQYGDFVNAAQAMIDEFVVSSRAKWGYTPSLVLLLPHGYEGQGPDHSSARMERFLRLAAETNMRIANPTTAAQYFHLLRRQAALLRTDPLPLVVMTPKSLLRSPYSASSLRDLAEGGWQPVIDDAEALQRAEAVRRLILCSGKVYVDMMTHSCRAENQALAIVRVEQLYPFPADGLRKVLGTGKRTASKSYPGLKEVIWLQEEPENMGAWDYLRPQLEELIAGRWPLRYIGRPRSSSPAEGSASWHAATQKAIISAGYDC